MIFKIYVVVLFKAVTLSLGYKLEFLVGETSVFVFFFLKFPGSSDVQLGSRTTNLKDFI